MNLLPRFLCLVFGFLLLSPTQAEPPTGESKIPPVLQGWSDWALWNDRERPCPSPYDDARKHFCLWPSRLALSMDAASGHFELTATLFAPGWVSLPGGGDLWPREVVDSDRQGEALPVVEHDGSPAVHLPAGTHRLAGNFAFAEMPQSLGLPEDLGLLALTLDGQPVETPSLNPGGALWLKRDGASQQAEKNYLSVKLNALLEDGIPLWLHVRLELIVSGRSREEVLGAVLPAGWNLAAVKSAIPVAVDREGRLKAQVRPGKWTVELDAFRIDNSKSIGFEAKPPVAEAWIAFRSKPDFRVLDLGGLTAVDASQVPFPEEWRKYPLYRWETAAPFRLEERMRGMGAQNPAGLQIERSWWLDEDGRGITFRDTLTGAMQERWRLDAAPEVGLGSVRVGGEGQLVTLNPQTGAPGVELRTRNLNVEATGRMARGATLSASGWQTDAEGVTVTLNLPPGWRLFALFGADWVKGDWLTAWTLLDLFLLLIFTFAAYRLWGIPAAVLAFVAFGLSFHEPGAPRYAWLALLIPVALLRIVPQGRGRRVLLAFRALLAVILALILIPFLAGQIRQALYPQLERPRSWNVASGTNEVPAMTPMEDYAMSAPLLSRSTARKGKPMAETNLKYEAKARIQTGPGIPEWNWRTVSFGWKGPVTASERVRPVLLPAGAERMLGVLRILLLVALAARVLDARRLGGSLFRSASRAAALALLGGVFLTGPAAMAQGAIPDEATLKTLRERLLEVPDAFPHAAEIPLAFLKLEDRRLRLEVEIHCAAAAAVPLPARLPVWSPVSVEVDGKTDAALRREDGFLWIALPEGVHRVVLNGVLADVADWEWTFRLRPRRVAVEAPEWTVTGIRPGGVPEAQVFLSRQQKAAAGAASYDRQALESLVAVERRLELGLVWQVRTTVTRLSPVGKAIALRLPLLPGEAVLTSNAQVAEGTIEVRLGAQEKSWEWASELPVSTSIPLVSPARGSWVERWQLVASPVWNVRFSGLQPVFEAGVADLVPVWHPWPGESVELLLGRPEAVPGATVTVAKAASEITLGHRQRASILNLTLQCSLGEDFAVELPAGVQITALRQNGNPLPIRQEGARLIFPVRPGRQAIALEWKESLPLAFHAVAGAVRLPVESANVETLLKMPGDRWTLWTHGPQRGPAVQFWVILAVSLLAAAVLGRVNRSPLGPLQWMLLAVGLTQAPLPAALVVVGWLFFLAWRGSESFRKLPGGIYNLLQVVLAALTLAVLGILVGTTAAGLLGSPEMFIAGNKSNATLLSWYEARSGPLLPQPGAFSVSIWWYRLLMLLWALWLAFSLLRWLAWGWRNFGEGGFWRKSRNPAAGGPPPPPLPRQG